MNNIDPIGIFDSGVGGTSIWKEINQLLPLENTIYLADSINAPYGNKTSEEIISLSKKNTELLIQKGCKIIVVACNTATTNAISLLRSTYDIPIIGIEPAIKPAALNSSTKCVGILATKGTLSSDLFHKTSQAFAKDIKIIEVIGEGLVPLIEDGAIHSDDMRSLLKIYTAEMIREDIDYLVLGCSHYPYIIPELQKILPSNVKIIDSGLAVAKQTKNVLETLNLLNSSEEKPTLDFYVNANKKTLTEILRIYQDNIIITKIAF
ncbi:glutamate racemase [Patiriisocius sp. Uisw_017]|jgi:glutamate racemase|uniref:glutamate racemase n=1 Tax=Patiriisocius sp. Uisw_017 TaxID=3230968 RepID=UPI0039EB6120